MKENILLFITHYDEYIDVCLSFNDKQEFDSIREMKKELNKKDIPLEEYYKLETDIFYEYLKLVGVSL